MLFQVWRMEYNEDTYKQKGCCAERGYLEEDDMKEHNWNKKIEIKNEKQIKAWFIVTLLHYFMMYLYDVTERISPLAVTRLVSTIIMVLICLMVWVVYKKIGIYRERKEKDVKSELLWVAILLFLSFGYRFCLGEIPAHPQFMFSGGVTWEGVKVLTWMLFYYALVGVTEEFKYRVYIQGELSVLLGRAKILAPVIGALIFGFMHYPQRGPFVSVYNIGIGLIFGFSYHFSKRCTYRSLALAHALLDFLIVFMDW